MYLNDHQRGKFYESLGLNTTQFNQHVIIETNKTTERIFPEVPDVNNATFWKHMEHMVSLNETATQISNSGRPTPIVFLQMLPIFAAFLASLLNIWFMPPKEVGSYDMAPNKGKLQY